MIKFLDLTGQIEEGKFAFAFYNKAQERFVEFNNVYVFTGVDDFLYHYGIADIQCDKDQARQRFLSYIPDVYKHNRIKSFEECLHKQTFTNISTVQLWEESSILKAHELYQEQFDWTPPTKTPREHEHVLLKLNGLDENGEFYGFINDTGFWMIYYNDGLKRLNTMIHQVIKWRRIQPTKI